MYTIYWKMMRFLHQRVFQFSLKIKLIRRSYENEYVSANGGQEENLSCVCCNAFFIFSTDVCPRRWCATRSWCTRWRRWRWMSLTSPSRRSKSWQLESRSWRSPIICQRTRTSEFSYETNLKFYRLSLISWATASKPSIDSIMMRCSHRLVDKTWSP